MSLIRLRNLNFSYRTSDGEDVPVLKNLNLEVHSGELLAIQGPSGSGKSTLLYIIGCLLNSYQGDVEISGQNIASFSDEQLAILRNQHIGFVFQQFHLLPKATVLDNILLPSQYPSETPKSFYASIERAEKLIDELGLQGRSHHFPNQLSGGQQQRVSIARALLNDAQIILADEPTGSLDTHNSKQIMELLKSANKTGRTVIIITHDPEIAQQCNKVVHFRDGEIKEIVDNKKMPTVLGQNLSDTFSCQKIETNRNRWDLFNRYIRVGISLIPLALQSLKQNKSRSILTMLGIVIGVAAVLSMITIGSFTKNRILESYAEMGVNTIMFYGFPNWELKATDQVPVVFQSFNWNRDLVPLKKVFPEVIGISPMMRSWDNKISYAGKIIDSDVRSLGVSADGLPIANRKIIIGNNFSPFHIEYRSAVCVIGFEIYQRLFMNVSPVGQIVTVSQRDYSFGCRVIGVLESQTSNKEWSKPNLQIYLPYTFFQGTTDPWASQIRDVVIQVRDGADASLVGKKIKAFFEMKYGKSARFDIGSDSKLIAQMNKFLSLFTILLAAIAMVSLAVGGIGITNMMLVSVSERFKEIGIRKAFGATNFSIRVQYLVESVLICSLAGAIGLTVGFILYEGAIYGATKLISNLTFEWIIDLTALSLSIISIFVVGVLSGLTPALKAEKLQVIEALRSE
ncbi:MAG: ATP-binding cassette domain-containing protein [Bdellovibrionaceae bacterium]|nr:ATP-binding cassette domain-containing protein [Pseudobdellovibrionaceae bacterium]